MTIPAPASTRGMVRDKRNAASVSRRFLADRRGTTTLEFALVASGFLFLLMGSIEVGLLWWTENGLQTTADLTARCAALDNGSNAPQACQVNGAQATPQQFAVDTAKNLTFSAAISAPDVAVTYGSTCRGANGTYNQFTLVTITSTAWAGRLIAPLAGGQIAVSSCYPNQN